MTAIEITFNVAALLGTAGAVWYMRHLVKTCGTDPVEDPNLVRKFKNSAPYHRLDNVMIKTG